MHAAGQFKLLQRNLRLACTTKKIKDVNIIDENMMNASFNKLRDCIKQHQLLIRYMERIENLYSMIMLAMVFGAVLQIGFAGFQILLVTIISIFQLSIFNE